MNLALLIIAAYLIGSIPTAYWIGKLFFNIDIREHGSKNMGASNTFRVLGAVWGIIVLLIDMGKGIAAVQLADAVQSSSWLGTELTFWKLIFGLTAVAGHIFPIFAGFRGGKGVATSLGIVIGINPYAAIVCLVIFLAVFISSRFVSLGAITAALCFPFISYFIINEDARIMIVFTIVLGTLVIFAHRKNIDRLLKGQENKMNLFSKKT